MLEPIGMTVASRGVAGASAPRVGLVVWLASELMFFAGLFAAYFALAAANEPWPPAAVDLPALRAGLFCGVLVASGVGVYLAARAAAAPDASAAAGWLGLTMLAGGIFLADQVLEYRDTGFGIGTDAFGSIFAILVFFHGLHLLAGLVAMAVVAGRLLSGSAWAAEGTQLLAYYWYFVILIGIAVYAVLYLIR